MVKRFRIYGDTLDVLCNDDENGRPVCRRIEKAYTEYIWDDDLNGYVVYFTGSEDFTPKSYDYFVRRAWVYTWDGEKRNAGGNRWFECRRLIFYRKSDVRNVKEWLKGYYHAELVQLR